MPSVLGAGRASSSSIFEKRQRLAPDRANVKPFTKTHHECRGERALRCIDRKRLTVEVSSFPCSLGDSS
jgi:hypothetical protein